MSNDRADNSEVIMDKDNSWMFKKVANNNDLWIFLIAAIVTVIIVGAILIVVIESVDTPDSELPDGYRVSLYVFEGEHVESIRLSTNRGDWESDNIRIGESVILPTGENVTLLEFDSENYPLFSVK